MQAVSSRQPKQSIINTITMKTRGLSDDQQYSWIKRYMLFVLFLEDNAAKISHVFCWRRVKQCFQLYMKPRWTEADKNRLCRSVDGRTCGVQICL